MTDSNKPENPEQDPSGKPTDVNPPDTNPAEANADAKADAIEAAETKAAIKDAESEGMPARPADDKADKTKAATPAKAGKSSSKARQTRNESLGLSFIVLGILVALNIIGFFWFVRGDVTETRAFTLSEGSRRLVRNLDDQLTVTAYFTDNLPPPHNATVRYVRDILSEYRGASGGRLRVRFVSPETDEEKQEAEERGIQATRSQSIQDNEFRMVDGYRGISFEYQGNRRQIPVVQDTDGLEYSITMEIKQLIGDRVPVGVLSGHEGPTTSQGLTAFRELLPQYDFREVAATSEIDRSLKALLIIEPHNALSDDELRYINQYVMRGGALGVFGGSMHVNLENQADLSVERSGSNLNQLLEPWGLRLSESVVADAQCERTQLPGAFGPVPHPPYVVASVAEEQQAHPVLFRLRQVMSFVTTPVETTTAFRANHGVVLLQSSERSWLLNGGEGGSVSVRPRQPQEWNSTIPAAGFHRHNLAAVVSGRLPNAFGATAMSGNGPSQPSSIEAPEVAERDARVAVFGSSFLLHDEIYGERRDMRQIFPILSPYLNAVDWLAQDRDLIEIRAKSVDEPRLEMPRAVLEAEQEIRQAAEANDEEGAQRALERGRAELEKWSARKKWIQWLNGLGIPVLFAAIGLGYMMWRRGRLAAMRP